MTDQVMTEPARVVPAWFTALPAREREVLLLIVAGRSAKEIAFELHRSQGYVSNLKGQLLDRLKLRNVVQLTRLAIRDGVVTL